MGSKQEIITFKKVKYGCDWHVDLALKSLVNLAFETQAVSLLILTR